MITDIFNSEYKVYYLALATSLAGAMMGIVFLLFKSVATLMMMMSGIVVLILGVIILGVAIYLDYIEGRFSPSYHQYQEND